MSNQLPTDASTTADVRHSNAVLSALPIAVVALDLSGRVLSWNRAAERLFGWTAQEVVGLPDPLAPEEEIPSHRKLFNRVLAGESLEEEVRRKLRNGSIVVLKAQLSPILDEQRRVVGVVKIFSDVSDCRRAQDALRESEDRFRLVVEHSPDVLFFQDVDLRYTWVLHPQSPALAERMREIGRAHV